MKEYSALGILVLVCAVLGATWRVRRAGAGSVWVQLLGGMNVFAAALLAWMTAAALLIAFNNELLSIAFLKWSSIGFAIVFSLIWIIHGVVPQKVAAGKSGKMMIAHVLLLIGTVVHGSVTFYMPALVWLGLVNREAGAVLPWMAIFTLPAACILWAIGIALIVDSTHDPLLDARAPARSDGAGPGT